MEHNHRLFDHKKTMAGDEPSAECSASCSPAQPLTPPPEPPLGLPDGQTPRLPDSHECRDCLAAMAHRLSQSITALRGGMELVLMGKRSEGDYRTVLEQSLQLADDMAQLIISMRELGESVAPGGAAQSVPLEVATAEVLAEMEGLAEARNLHLELNSDRAVRILANPERLHEALQSLLAWVIQSSAGGGTIALELTTSEGEARLVLLPPRLDLQYLQIKVLGDVTNPGLLFSQAAKNGALGWAINQRLMEGLGGRLEIMTGLPDAGCIRVRFSLMPTEAGHPS